jgi:uncharacterized SAM-binding protein YcdF (DUF218 family)
MFFLLSKLLNWLVYPVSLLFVGLLVILVFYRHHYARWGLACLLLLFYSLSTPIIVLPLVRWLEGPRPGPEALRLHYDVAIVLTGMVNLRGSRAGHIEFNESVERILEGISLVKRGTADKLFIVGGSGNPFDRSASEARVLRTFALEFGLHDAQVLTEEFSRNTYENAVKAAEIVRAAPYQDLVLITTAMHMRRAAAAFHKQGLFPDLYPVDFQSSRGSITPLSCIPSARTLDLMTAIIHELVGFATYRLQGYI